jgi:hypothetical protein
MWLGIEAVFARLLQRQVEASCAGGDAPLAAAVATYLAIVREVGKRRGDAERFETRPAADANSELEWLAVRLSELSAEDQRGQSY